MLRGLPYNNQNATRTEEKVLGRLPSNALRTAIYALLQQEAAIQVHLELKNCRYTVVRIEIVSQTGSREHCDSADAVRKPRDVTYERTKL